MFDQYSEEDLRRAALTMAAMVTVTFSAEFRRMKNLIPCTTGNINQILGEALTEAQRLEKEAGALGKIYIIHFCRVYTHSEKPETDFFDQPMTHIELALNLVVCKITGERIPDPKQFLS